MALVIDGDTKRWYEDTINVNGTTISSPNSPGTINVNGTKIHGLTGFSSETTLYSNGLAPDSGYFESTIVPYFQNNLTEAFHSQSYTQGPGQDSNYRVYVKEGYRVVSSDGTFTGSASPGTAVNFYEGKTVTGINTSHNGGTSFSIRRDDGV